MPQKSTRSPGAITSGTVLPAAASTSARLGRLGAVPSFSPTLFDDEPRMSSEGPASLLRRRQHDVAVLYWPMIPLQHDRPHLLFIAIERATRGPRNVRPANHLFAVQDHRHHPADQRDVVGLPLAGALRRILSGNQKPVDRAEAARGLPAAHGHDRVLDLRLVAAPQIDAAVAVLGIAELEVQLEVAKHRVAHEIATALRIGEHAI